jgi:hypothetical protein
VPGGNLADRLAALNEPAIDDGGVVREAVDETADADAGCAELTRIEPEQPAMPVMPFPTFQNVPTLPQQSPGNGFESGRDSRAR